MAGDDLGVMDRLGLTMAAIVDWSDGGNIGLGIAINNPDRLTKLFALGANYQVTGVRPQVNKDSLIGAYVADPALAEMPVSAPRPGDVLKPAGSSADCDDLCSHVRHCALRVSSRFAGSGGKHAEPEMC